jgi:hypothetical protein
MTLSKSEPCSSLWSCCDALRGGMDASPYTDLIVAQSSKVGKRTQAEETAGAHVARSYFHRSAKGHA